MDLSFKSITSRLSTFVVLFISIIFFVALLSVVGLTFVNDNAQRLTNRWLAGTQILGRISAEVSEFRIAENYRALAVKPGYEGEADQLAQRHRSALPRLFEQYESALGRDLPRLEFQRVRDLWMTYSKDHDRWIADDLASGQDTPALFGSDLHDEFVATDEAVSQLISINQATANTQAAQAGDLARKTIGFVFVSVIAAVVLAITLVRQIFSEISNPLNSLTTAVSSLAAGALDTVIPQVDRRDEIGQMAAAFEVFRMNAVALAEARSLADGLARYDALTGVANRRHLTSVLDDIVESSGEHPRSCGIMTLDLDRFKSINDVHGHAAGDMVLREVAARLSLVIGAQGTVARLGGDEFALIVPLDFVGSEQVESLLSTAQDVAIAIARPIRGLNIQVLTAASIGIALFPKDGQSAEAVLRAADLAMYQAKQSGRGQVRLFDVGLDLELRDKALFDIEVQQALYDGQIHPNFQPIVELRSGHIRGFEILARWFHPQRGFVPPDVFVPVLESLGLASTLTSTMLKMACRHFRGWDGNVQLAINVSPLEFQDPGLPESIFRVLEEEAFPPSSLEVEVTENAVLQDIQAARLTMSALRQNGVSISIDDFGTGYASLHHLKELRFDKLKIDRSFIRLLHEDAVSEKIVSCLIQLAQSMEISVVAEGIEDIRAEETLRRMGCEFGQGFFYSKAVDAMTARNMLSSNCVRSKSIVGRPMSPATLENAA